MYSLQIIKMELLSKSTLSDNELFMEIFKKIDDIKITEAASYTIEPIELNIIFKTLTGKIIPVTIFNTDTILKLKQSLFKLEGIMIDDQRLIYNGSKLEDNKQIYQYNIDNNDTIHLILRLRGGMFHKSSARADFMSITHINTIETGLKMLMHMKSYKIQLELLNELEHRLKNTKTEEEATRIYNLIKKYYVK